MKLQFKNKDHEAAFNKFVKKSGIDTSDKERLSLFYVLALNEDTRKHIQDLYDFQENWIRTTALNKAWQTGASLSN